jgi:hypothetical protein
MSVCFVSRVGRWADGLRLPSPGCRGVCVEEGSSGRECSEVRSEGGRFRGFVVCGVCMRMCVWMYTQ